MLNEYFAALSKNAPFVVMAVMGLAWLAGKLGAKGKVQLAVAFILGFLIGGAFQIASVGVPTDFTGWFYAVITAVLMGLMPSGFYEAAKDAASKFRGEEVN